MKAAITRSYGPADVLQIRDVPTPTLSARQVLIEVHASPVTAGDLRLRAADFPSFSAVLGRLMLGVFGPRRPVQGTMFAGRIVAVGGAVTRFAVGDDVFGYSARGAYAELLALPEDGALARRPAGLSYEEAAAIPYGAGTALRFLRDLGAVRPGERVLILGAGGGVGLYAVQLAKDLGAEVTGVCRRGSFDLVRSLGAAHVIDYTTEDFTTNGQRYDVIFDTADATSFRRCRGSLTAAGRYLTLTLSTGALLQLAVSALGRGPRLKSAVVLPAQADMEQLRALVERGALRPVIARRFPLDRIADAHAAAEEGRLSGSTMVMLRDAVPAARASALGN